MKNLSSGHAMHSLQNKVRGLVSAYKSRRFVLERHDSPIRDLRIGVRHHFLDARSELHPSEYETFIQWVDTQLTSQAIDFFKKPSGYDDLAGVYDKIPIVSLERELVWITARLKSLHHRLDTFIQLKNLIELATLSKRYEQAIELVRKLEDLYGNSIWSIQIRIALEHQAGGLERQKRYVSEVRSVYRTGLLGFIAYHTSVRNEEKTTIGKFGDDIINRIDRHSKYDTAIKTYLKFLMIQEWPSSEDKLAEVLRISQNHSIIDLYESLIGVAQTIIKSINPDNHIWSTLLRCFKELSPGLFDARIEKIVINLSAGQIFNHLPVRNSKISDSIFENKPREAIRQYLINAKNFNYTDPWHLIYCGFARAHVKTSINRDLTQPIDISRLIGRLLNQSYQSDDSLAQLLKILSNFSGFSVMNGVADFIPLMRAKELQRVMRPDFVGLNSPTLGIEDVPFGTTESQASNIIYNALKNTPTARAWKNYYEPTSSVGVSRTTPDKILFATGSLSSKNYESAYHELNTLINDDSAISIWSLVVSLRVRALNQYGARNNLIDLVAEEGVKGNQSFTLLSISEIFEYYTWEDFKDHLNTLSGPVALHLWLTAKDSEEVQSWMRFATAKFLKNSLCIFPSKLIDSCEDYPTQQLVYFLRNVCVPTVLDTSRVLKGTRKVLEERQAIYAALRSIDSKNSDKYQFEISLIANELALQEGHFIVDQSRIHVDSAALKKWAVSELAEDYDRYMDLVSVDLRPTKDFDEVVKEIIDGTILRVSFTPETEADALLYSMLLRLADEFLLNPIFGFDFYLSKRVRHQSFIGLIRGPLEFSNLITTREVEGGKYRDNEFWEKKFSPFDSNSLDAINEALLRFGARFDEVLLHAKNNLFHVRSVEKPLGLLGIDVTAQHMALMRSMMHPGESINEFVDAGLAMLWASLESSLRVVRKHIAEEIQVKIATHIDELRATVRKVAESHERFLEFDMEVGRSAADVLRALGDASRWFSRTSLDAQMRLFSLEQIVKVAIDSALKAQRAFDPIIGTEVHGSIQMRASALVFVHDVFFVALDNVRSYSGVKSPWVNISVSIAPDGDKLHIEVRSQVKNTNRTRDEKLLTEIRQVIANQTIGQRSRNEGRSGFLKIAAVVSQSSRGKIDFGYASDDEFFLHVTYSLLVIDCGDEHAEDN